MTDLVPQVEVDEDDPPLIEDEETGLVQLRNQAGPPHHTNERTLRESQIKVGGSSNAPHDQNVHAPGDPRRAGMQMGPRRGCAPPAPGNS